MQFKQRRWYVVASVLLFLVMSVSISGYLWGRSFFSSPTPSQDHIVKAHQSPEATPTPPLNMAANAHLIIAKIGVDAPVEPVQVQADGSLGVPTRNQWEGVGWYQKGPIPGQRGSAVIDGHLDRPGATPAVFWRLHEMSVGDIVTVEDASGHTLHFQVIKIESYPPNNAPTTQIFGNSSGTFLNLITCAGQWIPQQHQTSLRLVVYTTLVQ
ncbi:MAG TPA: class F sortase [Ktedonobacteraceae bacterium]|jgi:LPXTG-site transpeptidase (sortase) family protein